MAASPFSASSGGRSTDALRAAHSGSNHHHSNSQIMVSQTPRLGLDDYDLGDTDWDHSDLVQFVEEHAVERDTFANRPDTGEYDGEPFLAEDRRILYRWDAGTTSWEPVTGMGTADNPLPGTVHREALATDYAAIDHANPTITSGGQTMHGAGPLQSERSFGRVPTDWTDEGVIYSDTDVDGTTFSNIIDASRHIDNPLGQYYLYYAGYHSGDVRLAYSDDIESGWTAYSGNPIITPADHGDLNNHVSSPWVLWEPENSQLVMYAHSNLGGEQGTVKFTGTDGENWTYQRTVLDPVPGTWDGYTRSYLRAYRHGRMYFGLYMGHVKGASEGAQVGFAWSHDGDTWRTSRQPLFNGRYRGYSTANAGYSRASLIPVGGEWFVLASNLDRGVMEIGPLKDLTQPQPSMLDTNLTSNADGYSAFRGDDKLYLVGSPGTDIQLFSKPWGEIL